jgi:hypothetical protein
VHGRFFVAKNDVLRIAKRLGAKLLMRRLPTLSPLSPTQVLYVGEAQHVLHSSVIDRLP